MLRGFSDLGGALMAKANLESPFPGRYPNADALLEDPLRNRGCKHTSATPARYNDAPHPPGAFAAIPKLTGPFAQRCTPLLNQMNAPTEMDLYCRRLSLSLILAIRTSAMAMETVLAWEHLIV